MEEEWSVSPAEDLGEQTPEPQTQCFSGGDPNYTVGAFGGYFIVDLQFFVLTRWSEREERQDLVKEIVKVISLQGGIRLGGRPR